MVTQNIFEKSRDKLSINAPDKFHKCVLNILRIEIWTTDQDPANEPI